MATTIQRKTLYVIVIALLLAGCASLKQCAYRGVNRDQWQQPEKVIAALQIRPGDQIADLGAGGGYFTFKLANAAGRTGKVYAVDIDREMTDLIAQQAQKDAVKNVATIVAKDSDPMLPQSGVDLVFTSNTYHHIGDRVAYFANLRKYLRPGGKIAIIDYDRRAWIEGLLRHYTPSEFIKREMEQAGYKLQQEFDFLDRQSFLVFTISK
ncbi:MAG: methyltransferase domain-containing protein [Deltaproteobacteria bacterium]|nr:methyltransferase domain-containing protein [Deltaproteobacteria bacterium]